MAVGIFRIHFRGVDPALYLIPCADAASGFDEHALEAFAGAAFRLFDASSGVSSWEGEVAVEVIGTWHADDANAAFQDISGNSSNTILCRSEGGRPRHILKVMRRLLEGDNVEASINRHLVAHSEFRAFPPFLGNAVYRTHAGERFCIANLFGFQDNEGSAWEWCQRWLANFIDAGVERQSLQDEHAVMRRCGSLRPFIGEMGRVLADLHLALSCGPAPFVGEPIGADDARRLREGWNAQLERVLAVAEHAHADAGADIVIARLGCVQAIFDEAAESLSDLPCKIRQHGDFHLGQVLVEGERCFIIDYEGEPLKSLDERAALYPPFKDLAGMLRSFSYAAYAAFFGARERHGDACGRSGVLEACRRWEMLACEAFFGSWCQRLREQDAAFLPQKGSRLLETVLRAFMLDKVLYELEYEINNRPDWLTIPVSGIRGILEGKT